MDSCMVKSRPKFFIDILVTEIINPTEANSKLKCIQRLEKKLNKKNKNSECF